MSSRSPSACACWTNAATAPPTAARELPNNVSFDARSRLFAPFASPTTIPARPRQRRGLVRHLPRLPALAKKRPDAEHARLEGLLTQTAGPATARAPPTCAWATRATGHGPGQLLAAGRIGGGHRRRRTDAARSRCVHAWCLGGIVQPMLATLPHACVGQQARSTNCAPATSATTSRNGRGSRRGSRRGGRSGAAVILSCWPRRWCRGSVRTFFRDAQRDLYELPIDWPLASRWAATWAQMKAKWLSSWRPFGASWRIRSVRRRPAAVLAAGDARRPGRVLAGSRPTIARAYLRLQAEGSGEDAYQLASDLFASKGKADQAAGQRVHRADRVGGQARRAVRHRLQGDDLPHGRSCRDRRACCCSSPCTAPASSCRNWRERGQAARRIAAGQQVEALYGPQGKLGAFANDWLKPFITEKERLPVKVDGYRCR